MHTNGTSRFSVCDNEYKQPHSLKENVNIDTGEKSFVCSICSQRFNSNASLRNHELLHSDLSPYVCNISPERFERSDKLKDHMKKHDAILARMWYVTLYVWILPVVDWLLNLSSLVECLYEIFLYENLYAS